MPDNYVVFADVKKAVSILDILRHYDLMESFEKKGSTLTEHALTGPCPIHHGDNPRHFRVSIAKNCWYCFGGCHGGNILDFVSQKEDVSIRSAAILISEWFGLPLEKPKKQAAQPARCHKHPLHSVHCPVCAANPEISRPPPAEEQEEEPVELKYSSVEELRNAKKQSAVKEEPLAKPEASKETANKPLFFELKHLDADHSSIEKLGIDLEVVKHFGAGYCSKGLMKGRLAIPIHSPTGTLLGYAGRTTKPTDELVHRYKYPGIFRKEVELYNLHRAFESIDFEQLGLFLVPDFLDVWRFYGAGFENVAAVMDEKLSEEQMELLLSIIPAGTKLTLIRLRSSAAVLADHFYVRVLDVNPANPRDALVRIFGTSK